MQCFRNKEAQTLIVICRDCDIFSAFFVSQSQLVFKDLCILYLKHISILSHFRFLSKCNFTIRRNFDSSTITRKIIFIAFCIYITLSSSSFSTSIMFDDQTVYIVQECMLTLELDFVDVGLAFFLLRIP